MEPQKASPKKVGLNSSATLIFPDTTVRTFKIGVPKEANPAEGIISYESPLGKALLEKTCGEEISYQVGDEEFVIRIIDIA